MIDEAAAVAGKTRTEFMLESASRAAHDVLLDQRLFQLEARRFQRFLALLDAPPRPPEALRRLLARPAPWER
jgi:uncharacterized protein (DUF1778 family)